MESVLYFSFPGVEGNISPSVHAAQPNTQLPRLPQECYAVRSSVSINRISQLLIEGRKDSYGGLAWRQPLVTDEIVPYREMTGMLGAFDLKLHTGRIYGEEVRLTKGDVVVPSGGNNGEYGLSIPEESGLMGDEWSLFTGAPGGTRLRMGALQYPSAVRTYDNGRATIYWRLGDKPVMGFVRQGYLPLFTPHGVILGIEPDTKKLRRYRRLSLPGRPKKPKAFYLGGFIKS